jgi:hypothetical protein
VKAAGVDLFSAAAERAAMVSERPVSQEALRVKGIDAAPAGPLLVDTCPYCARNRAADYPGPRGCAACALADNAKRGLTPPTVVVHGFARDKTFCGLPGGSATTEARRVTCERCREALARVR